MNSKMCSRCITQALFRAKYVGRVKVNNPSLIDIFCNCVSDGFPEEKEVFDEYLYNFIHTSGFGGAYKSFIDVTNSSGGVNVSEYKNQT